MYTYIHIHTRIYIYIYIYIYNRSGIKNLKKVREGKVIANYYGDNSMYHRYEALVRHLRRSGHIPTKEKVMEDFPHMVIPKPYPGMFYMLAYIYTYIHTYNNTYIHTYIHTYINK